MSNSYDQIATVSIDIASVVVDSKSFDNILIVGPLPKVAPTTAPAKVGAYSDIEEVIKAGWVVTGENADPVGIAARIAFSQDPKPTNIYIAPQQVAEGTAEYAVSAVQRAMDTAGWYVVTPAGVAADELETLADFIETQEKMMVYTELDFFKANKAALGDKYNRTAGVYGRVTNDPDEETPVENLYMNVAFAVAWLAHESGSETAAFKALAGVNVSDLGTTERKALETASISFFTAIGNKKVTMIGKVLSGEWCDIIRFRDWLKNDMQVRAVNVFLSLPKVPFTDDGIALVQNAMEASLQSGQDKGGVCKTEYDDEGNETLGYIVNVPKAASLSDSEKQSRKLSGCTFKARLAGAIHFAELKGTLAYSL